MSRLDDFIIKNRNSFDDELPSERVWEGIEAGIPVKKGNALRLMPVIKWSAAACLLFAVTITMFFIVHRQEKPGIAVNTVQADTSTDVTAIAPEAAPEMNQFARLIALKQEELKILTKEQPELYQKFTTDITQLDSSYRNLKNQLSITPNKEMLLEAMVQNLQLQLNVLNQQLNIINQIKQKTSSHVKDKNYM